MRHAKAEALASRLATDVEIRRAVARRRSERVLSGAPFREPQAFRIVADLRGEALRPQCHRARHRLLHVRVSRQHDRALAQGERVERIRDLDGAGVQGLRRVAQIQAQRRQHLVVARTAGMQTAAGGADARGQHIFDGGLTVFLVERDAPAALRVFLGDGLERAPDGAVIGRPQQPRIAQHVGVCQGGADVVTHQAVVEQMVLACGVSEHALVERGPLVPQSAHG